MKSFRSIIFFLIICITIGIIGGFSLGFLVPRNTSPGTPPLIEDTLPEILTEPQVPVDTVSKGMDTPHEKETKKIKPIPKETCPVPTDPDQPDKWLLAVGPNTSAGLDYVPIHLSPLDSYVTTSKPMCLNTSAAVRLQQMVTAMRKEKLSVVISSAYRPASYQENLRTTSEEKRDVEKNPYPLVALPGHSEHQLGIAVDMVAGPKYTLDDFETTPEYVWLTKHAWQYGFIQSYPEGSESVTGYSAESWHWRYVGLVHVKNIHDQSITVYEYLQKLVQETNIKNP